MATTPATHPQAKRPISIIAGPYGHPFHPILVTIPIGAWATSLVFDVASQLDAAPQHTLVVGAQWLIVVGCIGALSAALFGLLDLLTIPRHTLAFRVGLVHMSLNLTITALFVSSFFWRYKTLTSTSGHTPGGMLALSAVGIGALLAAGWVGGMLSYHFGVRVADEETQAEGFRR